MPGEILTGPEAETFAGFFGKLPSTGDFVSRGLPDGFRRQWDAWITRHLAPRQRGGTPWPEGGLRFRLRSGGRTAAGVILPSADSAGRLFPLSLILIGPDLPGPEGLDTWCDAALDSVAGQPSPDGLWEALEDQPRPEASEPGGLPPFVLWTGAAREAVEAADPDDPLDRLLTASSS